MLFYTGSTTKTFTASILSLLVDDNETFPHVQWSTPIAHLDAIYGARTVISNVIDYAKWAKAIINRETLLSKPGSEALFTLRTLMPIQDPFMGPQAYALGWQTDVYEGDRFFGHSGGMSGFGAELLIFLDIKFSIVALVNTAGTSKFADQTLAFHLAEKPGLKAEEKFDWTKKRVFILSTVRNN